MDEENTDNNNSAALSMPSSDQSPNAEAYSEVLKSRDWLDSQNYDLAVALKAENMDLAESENIEELQRRISELKTELYKVKIEQTTKELIMKKAQLKSALTDKMFTAPLPYPSETEGEGEGEERDSSNTETGDRRNYEALLKEHSQLSSTILRKAEINEGLQKELDSVRKGNFELKRRNRGLMGALAQHRKRLEKMSDDVHNNAACQGLKDDLESKVSQVEIVKCTLQALIVGSGVNWAQDPDLLETVQMCGETLDV